MSLDCKKSGIPDKIETCILKISEPIASIVYLSLPSNYSAMVLLLLNGGDLSELNNYCPISRLSVLAKGFVSGQLKECLSQHNILSEFQSGFRSDNRTILRLC